MKSKKQVEKELVSFAGTLIYLGRVSSTLNNMPLVPVHMAGEMDLTEAALGSIPEAIKAAHNAVHVDSAETVAEWLLINKLTIEDVVTAKLAYGSADASIELKGKLECAFVYQHTIDGLRAIALRLSPFELTLTHKKTVTKLASAKAVSYLPEHYPVSANFADVKPGPKAGEDPTAINLLLPIQQEKRLSKELGYNSFIVRS